MKRFVSPIFFAFFIAALAVMPTVALAQGGTQPLNDLTAQAARVGSAIIVDGTTCTLADAITAANTDAVAGGCPAGVAGADVIQLTVDVTLSGALPHISSAITIEGGNHFVSGANQYQVFYVESSGDLTLHQVTVKNGIADDGGGVYNRGTLTVTNSTFSGNSASNNGGGIYNISGTTTVTNSTFSGNSASNNGGGIYNSVGTLTVTNSTFSGNSASNNGGGIFNIGTLTVTNSTLSGNSATYGGGVSNSATLTVQQSIVAQQTAGGDCYSPGLTITSGGHNIESGTSCGFAGAGDQQNVSAAALKLQPLGNYGGPTRAMALGAGSAALDQYACTGADQRGVSRPQNSQCDVGAFEYTTPTAAAGGPYSGNKGAAIALDGSGSADGAGLTLYEWDCTNDGSYDVSAASPTGSSCTYADNGGYTVKLRVTNVAGETATDTASVTVANVAPTVNAGGPYSGDEGSAIALDGSGSSDDSAITLYEWDCTDDGTYDYQSANPTGNACTYPDNGSYTVRLRVTDDGNPALTGEDTASVTVNNVVPTAIFGNDGPVNEGSDFTLSLTNPVDPGTADTFTYAFDCGDGNGYGVFAASSTATCPTTDNGVRPVKGKIRDNDGGETEYTASVTVSNVAPTAAFGNDGPVDEGSDFTLSLTNPSDPGTSDTFTYAFDCGDGNGYGAFSASSTATCPTTDNGVRSVKGKIRDKDGGESEYAASITVNNVAPTAAFGNDGPVDEGSDFTLSLTNPSDPGSNDTFTYAFDCGDGNGYGVYSASSAATCPTTDNGLRAVKGKIRDKDGGETEYTASVTVNNVAPTAAFGNDGPVDEGSDFTLSLTNPNDPGTADTFTYAFDCGDGSGYGAFSASSAATCATTDNGVRSVKGKIRDNDGGESEYAASITVNNVAPTAAFGNDGPVDEGSDFTLSLTNPNDPGTADTFTYAFDCGDGSGYGAFSASSAATCATTDNGVRSVKGKIRDNDGGETEYTASVTVNNVAPSVDVGPDQNGYEGTPFNFDGVTFTDPGTADTHTATIDWGDGTMTDPAAVTEPGGGVPGGVSGQHAYGNDGDYTITVCVTDDDGGRSCDSLMITVAEVIRMKGYVYNGPLNDFTLPLPDVTLHLYGANQGEALPGSLIATRQSQLDGFFNFYIIKPWFFDSYTLVAETPTGMVPLKAWSEDGVALDSQTVQWDFPGSTAHENIFTFETPTAASTEPVTATVTLPLLNDAWVTWGDPNGNYDSYPALIVRPTGLDNALLKFDRSLLPRNTNIISATLTVHISDQTGAAGKQLTALNVDAYTPAEANYAKAPAVYNPSASVEAPLGPSDLSMDVTSQVGAWDDDRFPSYRWGYLAISASGPNGRIILDSLESFAAQPAELTLTYTAP